MATLLKALWHHRALVLGLVRREFQIRSARAAWGTFWLFFQPATQIFIYAVIFGRVLQAKLPGTQDELSYGIYLCAGLLPWTVFSEQVGRGQNLFLENAHLLKTTRFPRSALAVSLGITSALNLALLAVPFAMVLVALDRLPGMLALAALPLLLLQSLLGVSLGVLIGTLNVFFRDIGQVVPVLLQFWFWFTPIVYPISIVPEPFRTAISWNPMTGLIGGYQQLFVGHETPTWGEFAPFTIIAFLTALLGWLAFRSLSGDLVDEL